MNSAHLIRIFYYGEWPDTNTYKEIIRMSVVQKQYII